MKNYISDEQQRFYLSDKGLFIGDPKNSYIYLNYEETIRGIIKGQIDINEDFAIEESR